MDEMEFKKLKFQVVKKFYEDNNPANPPIQKKATLDDSKSNLSPNISMKKTTPLVQIKSPERLNLVKLHSVRVNRFDDNGDESVDSDEVISEAWLNKIDKLLMQTSKYKQST